MATSTRYSFVAMFFHWLIALLIIGQLIGGLVMVKLLPRASSLTFELYQFHKSIGITILGLSVLRLLWRLTHRAPALPETMPGWQRVMAGFSHIGFYVFMIGMPLIGWAMVSVSPLGIQTFLFKTIHLPHMPFWNGVENLEPIETLFKNIHEYVAYGAIALIVLHVGAALMHHFKDRDDVLIRMLPLLKNRSANTLSNKN